MIEAREIADRLNDQAAALCRELLPNGRELHGKWMAYNVHDLKGGGGYSLAVTLSGPKIGHWADYGGCPADEAHGDMLDLLRHARHGGDMRSALAEAKARLGIEDRWTPGAPARPSPEEMARRAEEARLRAERRAAALEQEKAAKMRGARGLFLHAKAVPVEATPAEYYLRGRLIEPGAGWPHSLRYHAEVYNKEAAVKIPALLAMAVTPEGVHVATHRTFLQNCARRGWCKIDSANAKMVLGPCRGAFIPVNRGSSNKTMRHMPADEPIYMTEGLEDALTVRMYRPALRIIAGISLGNMGAIVFPTNARRLVIVADRDEKQAAIDVLERSIAQQQARGMTVELVMPPEGQKDVNGWLQSLSREKAA